MRTGAALLMTEFGDTTDANIHRRLTDLADEFMVGWTVWGWFRAAGQIKIDPAKPPTPGNVHRDVLGAVVRPYPRVVAGTPRSYAYERATKRFSLRFSTKLPGGRRAGGLESEVFVPSLHYGHRYRVSVIGGELVGGMGTQLLRVRACRGATEVRLRVSDEAPRRQSTCPARPRDDGPDSD